MKNAEVVDYFLQVYLENLKNHEYLLKEIQDQLYGHVLECYNFKHQLRPKIFLNESVINAFTQEEVRLQYKPIMVHEKGINEPVLDYIKGRITDSKEITTTESGSPFKKMKLHDLPDKMLRLDQVPCF